MGVALGYSFFGHTDKDKDWTLPALCVGLIGLLASLLCVVNFTEWYYRDLLLEKVLLLIAVMNTLYATYDILDDCVYRRLDYSDASRYAALFGSCCNPRIIGGIWFSMSLILAVITLLLAVRIQWLYGAEPVESLADISRFSWMSMAMPFV